MNTFNKALGKRLGVLRRAVGATQEVVARAIRVERSAVSLIEVGKRDVSAEELVAYSKLFGLTVEAILDPAKEPAIILPSGRQKTPPAKVAEPVVRINIPQNNVAKFREVLLYVLEKIGSRPNIGETVLYKLLYFIDFDYYERYEEQLIGARFRKNHFGPTPVAFQQIVKRMIEANEVVRVKSEHFQYPQTKYLPLRSPDLSVISSRELQLIDNVLDRLGSKNAREISEYSHGDIPWRMAGEGELLEYEAVFYRTQPYSMREYAADVP
jgi:transcriptional regulator with XRE-family HTH domain